MNANAKAATAMIKELMATMPITLTIQQVTKTIPGITKQEITEAGNKLGLNPNTVVINFRKGKKQADLAPQKKVRKVKVITSPRSLRKVAKPAADYPDIGDKVNFIWTGSSASAMGMNGKKSTGTVLGYREDAVIIMPDPMVAQYGAAAKPTFCYRPNLIA